MEDRKITKIKSEAFDAYERVRPLLEEYFDSWIITGHRAGCKTRIVLADIEKDSADMKEQLAHAKEWKNNTLEDTN
jgi:hypothetical protein